MNAVAMWALALGACVADDGGPRLDAAMPASAGRGATIVVSGHRLCGASADCAHAGGQIQIGITGSAIEATIVSYGDTSAQIVIPPTTPIGVTSIVATVNNQASNALAFEVLP